MTRQSLEAARFATADEARHAAVLKRVYQLILDKGFTAIPPLVAQHVQRIVREETGNDDPYAVQKRQFNDLMLSVRERLRQRILASADPLRTATQLSIAGNTIDYAVRADWNEALVFEAIESALRQSVNGSVEEFVGAVGRCHHLLYLLDNCGEIVCDQLLIEELKRRFPKLSITAVVRGAAVLNDATWTDVRQIGLEDTVAVVDNGNDAVGTVLEQCGPAFQEVFQKADLIVSKGLANYETLIEYGPDELWQTVCFLFKAKCPFIAKYSGVRLGDLVVRVQKR